MPTFTHRGLASRAVAFVRQHRLLAVMSIALVGLVAPTASGSGVHEADRFAIRGGIWPHKAVSGSLGHTQITLNGPSYDARVEQKKAIAPFIELTGLFHIRRFWWAEGDFGWSTRTNISVGGVLPDVDSVLLIGRGRVDFFPLFVGVRAIRTLGTGRSPHNIYARAGLSIVFASESPGPSGALDSLQKYNVYDPGTEAAFGFAVGLGGEVHYYKSVAVVADVQFRYVRFNYGPEAKFDLSGVWFSLGFSYQTR
jgi:hypothetical protein